MASCLFAASEPPRIAHVHPDFQLHYSLGGIPAVITGEHFQPGATTVLFWTPPWSEKDADEGLGLMAGNAPTLPVAPPVRSAIVPLDVEPQVIVTPLSGAVVWVKTPAGVSPPYIIGAARPFWLSHETATPGAMLHAFGFGLRQQHHGPRSEVRSDGCRIALKRGDDLRWAQPLREARATGWIADSRLVYFTLPADLPYGLWEVYFHNERGGAFGWGKAGEVEVTAPASSVRTVFDIRESGALGDGLADDTAALAKALAAAGKAEGGIVFLPPGVYRTRRTLALPAGVTLRGAGRDQSIVEGFGGQGGEPLAAVVALTDDTALDGLEIRGAVAKGVPSTALVCGVSAEGSREIANVTITSCRLRALEEEPAGRGRLYGESLNLDRLHNFTLNNNDIHGGFFFRYGRRMEIIRNTFRHTTARATIAIHGWAVDSLLDANLFTDTPGRICFYPVRHCYIRFNEIHQAFRGTWTNAEEVYLVHGTYGRKQKTVGRATGGTATTLTDASRPWQPGLLEDAVVMITAGKGFGQYRFVHDNTEETLTVDRPWNVIPDLSSEYVTGLMYTENAFYGNLNNTPGRMSLWLDCIANVVEMHRDANSKGIDIWGADASSSNRPPEQWAYGANSFLPAWYNMILNGWMDGSALHLLADARDDNLHAGPPLFANTIANNKIRQPHAARTGFDHVPDMLAGIMVGSPRKAGTPVGHRVGLSHTIVHNNYLSFTEAGLYVSSQARKTFVVGNTFRQVARPWLDGGRLTVFSENRTAALDTDGVTLSPVDVSITRLTGHVPPTDCESADGGVTVEKEKKGVN